MDDQALEGTLEKFHEVEDWLFNGYAESSSQYLKSMLHVSVLPAIEKAILVAFFWRERYHFLSTLLQSTITTQTPVGVVMGFCILFACFLPSIFAIIIVYRRKQKQGNLGTLFVKGRKSLWASFVVFVLSSCSALISAIILGMASGRGYFTLVIPFKFAEKSVESAFHLSGMLHPLFENYIREMSHATFESSLALYKVDEYVAKEYLDRVHDDLNPVFEIAGTLNYQMTQALEKLSHHHGNLPHMLNRTVVNLKRLAGKYEEAVRNVRQTFGHAELQTIVPFPDVDVTSESVGTLEPPIALFRNLSKINLQLGFREMNNQLEDIAYQEYFDPTDLVSEVRHFAFEVESRLNLIVEKYLSFVERGFRSDKDNVSNHIENLEDEAMTGAYPIFCFLIAVSLLSIALVFALLTVHALAFASVLLRSRGGAQPVWKYQVPCGRILLYLTFFNTCLLIVMWVLSLVLFLLSVVSMEGCVSVGDKSVFDVTFDDRVFHEKPHWFGMFSSTDFNMTVKNTVTRCADGSAYVPFIPEDIPSKSDAETLVAGVNYTSVADLVKVRIQNLSGYNDSFFSVPANLSGMLSGVDVRPMFNDLRKVQERALDLQAVTVLKKLHKRTKDEKVRGEIDDAVKAFQDALLHLGNAIAAEKEFDDSLLSVRHLLMTYEKGLDDMVKTSASLVESVVRTSPSIYEKTLKRTVARKVDDVLFDMRLTIRNFRKEIAFCKYVLMFYDVMRSIFCNILLYPVVTAWKMTLLMCFFQVVMIVTSVLPLHVFLDEARIDDLKPPSDVAVGNDEESVKDKDKNSHVSEALVNDGSARDDEGGKKDASTQNDEAEKRDESTQNDEVEKKDESTQNDEVVKKDESTQNDEADKNDEETSPSAKSGSADENKNKNDKDKGILPVKSTKRYWCFGR